MSGRHKKVLVASGTASVNNNINDALNDSGYEISAVASDEACIEQVASGDAILVFISLFDRTTDAGALVARIRARDSELPIVLMADAETAGQVVPLLDQGASDYLLYPAAHPGLIAYAVSRNLRLQKELRRRKRGERDLKRLNRTLLDSLKELEQDQQAGLRVQQGMMPESPFRLGELQLEHRIVPSLILSGDFIDYFELPDGRLLFYIADVSGHGTSGAIVTVLLKSFSTRLYNEFDELGLGDAAQILGWFNRELLACGLPQHVTMFLGVMDKAGDSLQYANAAHFPATILSSPESTRYLESGGLPLGIYESAQYTCRHEDLPKSFSMVMFSDGIFEIFPGDSLKTKEEGLLSLVESGGSDVDVLAERLGLGEVNEVPDDIAVFTLEKAG